MIIKDIHIDLTINENRDINFECHSHYRCDIQNLCGKNMLRNPVNVSAYIHFIGAIFQSVRLCTLQSFTFIYLI